MTRVAFVTILMIGISLLGMPFASAQTEGLEYAEDTVVTAENGTVRIDIDATMANTTVERREGNAILYSFFDELLLATPVGARNFSVTSRGSTLSSSTTPIDDDFELRVVELPTELRSGESRTFSISYELPAGELRGDGLFFVNPAQSAFPLWSFSDPGLGSLELRIPRRAVLNDVGSLLRQTGADGDYVTFEPVDFSVPADLFAYVTITDDEALETRALSVAGQNIEINSWPGDEVWADFAEETISVGLPVFEEVIGLPVPDQSTLEVTESVTPYFFGYGGWYSSVDTSIDIGNELDDTVMLHELSHAWFNADLFTDRWIAEGLAEEFTWRVQGELNTEQEIPPAVPRLTDRGALPLESWDGALVGTTNSDEFQNRETYGYATSWFTMRQIVSAIGLEDMQAVLRDADVDAPSYPDAGMQLNVVENDWRRLLDLTALHATAEESEVIETLFADYVVQPDNVDQLDRRREARTAYELLSERAPGWAISEEVGTAMSRWDFERAQELLDAARAVQDEYLRLEVESDRTGVAVSDSAREAYEEGGSGVDGALLLLQRQFGSIGIISEMELDVDSGISMRQRLGLLGGPALSDHVDDAKAELADDDFVGVAESAVELQVALQQADRTGALRMAVIFAVLALFLVAAGFLVWRRSNDDEDNPPTRLAPSRTERSEDGEIPTTAHSQVAA